MSNFARTTAERHEFYDELLKKVLALPIVQADIEEMRKDEEWNKEHNWGEFEFAEAALENFIEGDDKDILAVPEIWVMIQGEIRDVMKCVTYDAKTFVEERSALDIDRIYTKKIEEIHDGLCQALKRKQEKEQEWNQKKSPGEKLLEKSEETQKT